MTVFPRVGGRGDSGISPGEGVKLGFAGGGVLTIDPGVTLTVIVGLTTIEEGV